MPKATIDTGKVVISSHYEPPLPRESDTDMLRLQRALLPAPCSSDTDNYLAADLALYVVSAIALVVIIFT